MDVGNEFYTHIEAEIVAKKLNLVGVGYDVVSHVFLGNEELVLPLKETLQDEASILRNEKNQQTALVAVNELVSRLGELLYGAVTNTQNEIYAIKLSKAKDNDIAFFEYEAGVKGTTTKKLISAVIRKSDEALARRYSGMIMIDRIKQRLSGLLLTMPDVVKYIATVACHDETIFVKDFDLDKWVSNYSIEYDPTHDVGMELDVDITLEQVLVYRKTKVEQDKRIAAIHLENIAGERAHESRMKESRDAS